MGCWQEWKDRLRSASSDSGFSGKFDTLVPLGIRLGALSCPAGFVLGLSWTVWRPSGPLGSTARWLHRRAGGHCERHGESPRETKDPARREEAMIANRVRGARKRGDFSDEQEAEIAALYAANARTNRLRHAAACTLMQEIRAIGRLPGPHRGPAEDALRKRLATARASDTLTPEHLAELDRMKADAMGPLEEAEEPADPQDPFSELAANRLEQDLLMMEHGVRTKAVKARCAKYRRYVEEPALRDSALVLKYKASVLLSLAAARGKSTYMAGCEIRGDELREFSGQPTITAPIVCQLCDSDFISDRDFARHVAQEHGSMNEYRKRTIYLMEMQGPRALTSQEKRLIVQNNAHFQQFSRPGTGGNTFSSGVEDVSRCEAACGVCQRKDFIEHRYRLNLFGEPPETERDPDEGHEVAEGAEPGGADQPAGHGNLKKHHGVYFLQNPDAVHSLLDVDRYAARWPLIPRDELHASSVEHPSDSGRRWLLHVRSEAWKCTTPPVRSHSGARAGVHFFFFPRPRKETSYCTRGPGVRGGLGQAVVCTSRFPL